MMMKIYVILILCVGITTIPKAAATTTSAPTTVAPTTAAPTTVAPTTVDPTTVDPTTVDPTTVDPTTVDPTTVDPTTVDPTTVDPTTVDPTTVDPTTAAPTTVDPTTVDPTTVDSTTAAPTTAAPTTAAPTTTISTTAAPTTTVSTTAAPTTTVSTTAAPTTVALTTARVSFRSVKETFTTDLLNPSSAAFKNRAAIIKGQLEPVFQRTFSSSFRSLTVVSFSRGSVINTMDLSFVSTFAPNNTQIASSLINAASSVSGFDIEGSSINVNGISSGGVSHKISLVTAACLVLLSWLI
ncbi:salivary glue protein Sgs-3-like [Perca fluviatilis]|uniref:salivary glue protein Sgs-3-like n=1 Tax=Perca fluviatilis TaxID=8168 RepID=UPI00196276B6|nr:salivary glue protein Sgs-3-like [Perca fluviatilis]